MKFGEWTKLSDEIPPKPISDFYGDSYLCTVNNNQVVFMRYERVIIREKEVCRWKDQWGKISTWDIIAYMPFPEPYKK